MVLVFSTNSHNSDEVKKEIVLAGQCRLNVIPVRVEDVTPEGAFAYELATRQWVDLFEDWERSIQRLVEQIVKVTGQQPGAVSFIIKPHELGPEISDEAARPPQHAEPVKPSPSAPDVPIAVSTRRRAREEKPFSGDRRIWSAGDGVRSPRGVGFEPEV